MFCLERLSKRVAGFYNESRGPWLHGNLIIIHKLMKNKVNIE